MSNIPGPPPPPEGVPPTPAQQQPPEAPPMPPHPGQLPPLGVVQLTIQGSIMTSNAITPKAVVNGYPVPTSYGLNEIPVPSGPVHIAMSAQWLRTYGQAQINFQLGPGQAVPIFYAAPLHQFTDGSIGFEKVKRKGIWGLVGILGVVVVVVGVMVGIAIS